MAHAAPSAAGEVGHHVNAPYYHYLVSDLSILDLSWHVVMIITRSVLSAQYITR